MEPFINTQDNEETVIKEETPETKEFQADRKADRKIEKSGKPPRPISNRRLVISLLIKLSVIMAVVWLILTFVVGISINYGNQMHPAINDGDLVISFKLQGVYLNAAILYRQDGKTRTGRVIGLKGDVIDISSNGELFINNAAASEDIFYPTYKAEGSDVRFPYTVGEGEAFILNDFREDTDDSRSFGTVDLGDIDGPVILILRRRNF